MPAGFLHHLRGGPSGTGFAAGGVLDTLAPGPWLADALAAATATTAAGGGGHGQLGESELIGVLCGWRRIASWAAAGEADSHPGRRPGRRHRRGPSPTRCRASRRRPSRHARADAAVTAWDEASGNAALAGRELPPAEVLAADARLTALAKWLQARGAAGTISQLRAAVYTALLNGRPIESLLPDPDASAAASEAASGADGVPGGAAPAGPAVSGSIHLTMPLAAFLGSGQPGEVAGHGPVDAATSRDLAAMLAASPATRWCLTLTGPGGRAAGHACARSGPATGQPVIRWAAGLRDRLQILETGSCSHPRQAAGYVPPSQLRHLVQVRQRRCSHPGCRRPAVRGDLDHTIPYDHGGRRLGDYSWAEDLDVSAAKVHPMKRPQLREWFDRS